MMTSLFLKNNPFLLIIKGLLSFLICLLILLQNIGLIQYTNSMFNLKGIIKKDRIEINSICLLDFNHDSVDYETMNEIYQMLKQDNDVLLQYSFYSSSDHVLYMDIETYRNLFDETFHEQTPCVLVPERRLSELDQFMQMKVVGSNSRVKADSLRFGGYDPLSDFVVLYEDLIIDQYGDNFAFYPGHSFILSTESKESVHKIQDLLLKVKEAFAQKGYSINFISSRLDSQLNHQNENSEKFLKRESLQNISSYLILISGILLLSQIMILFGKKLIATCLFLGKKKHEIYFAIISSMIPCDFLAALFSLPLLNKHLFECSTKTHLLCFAVLFAGLILLDMLTVWILLYTTDSKKLLQEIQQREE